MEQLGVGEAMPREELWQAKWASPMVTAMTIHNQARKEGWSFHCLPASPGAHHIT